MTPRQHSAQDDSFVRNLRSIAGKRHVLTAPSATYRFRKGYRFGLGDVLAVVQPGTLIELWRTVKACVESGRIIIVQASNTGLTGGSTPDGNDYDRDIVIISTSRLKGIHLIGDGRQVVCLPGATLNRLEEVLAEKGREPHSVIGSSCIGASVLGGVSNNSGGALMRRGPAFTEMALFGQVGADGTLRLVNHLGIALGDDPETILHRVEAGHFPEAGIDWNAGRGHDSDYAHHVRDIDAETPARYNADPRHWHEAAGCAGKLVVFAVRLDTFPAERDTAVFYIGSDAPDAIEGIRRGILGTFEKLPIAGEYIHREAFDIAETYGKDTFAVIRYFGTKHLPALFAAKSRFDILTARFPFLPSGLSDRLLQAASRVLPKQIPARMSAFRDRFEHHLILKVSHDMRDQTEAFLKDHFSRADGDYFACTPDEGTRAFLHRFAVAGAAVRYRAVHPRTAEDIVALDVALRRNDRDWVETLPPEIGGKLSARLYYGHFFCHVMHQDYVVRKGFDAMEIEHAMLRLLDRRGARYPAEHNVGHLYHAPDEMKAHYRALDPCNCLNPGIGRSTKRAQWRAESVEAA
ncbi:D-lactate dehydrogenase [Tanticharoenia sakaeratensis]|uniref:Quinone-dependent D-lactate dehydrogenase n=1 Tax=Tanticharoenia sakaeratensis NBRC 103193 TaxID=1231623 RepID=A0A0D6MMW2_9PROT|nr:D-lactate dehydrogenase [Tanticharoenia sakaeratensis]GAN54771.1 D-Lactate dehydrogenase NAD dependent [Tanticharoenia sakaeratensis NBRC 103193]GBQ23119.1 D-lactate dehydrogenase [Tanticharoenia sakaeratensis NBRC 103193]